MYIRTPGEGLSKITETSDNELKDCYDAGNIDKAVKVYDAPRLPGRETKLNIAKQANGPSVSVQYSEYSSEIKQTLRKLPLEYLASLDITSV